MRIVTEIEGVLRSEDEHAVGIGEVPWRRITSLVVSSGLVYGLVMGSLGWKLRGSFYTGLKVPLLLTFSTFLCLPFFYVLNVCLGLRDDFSAALRGIFCTQTTLALSLAGLSPVVSFLYASHIEYPTALLVNGAAFALSSLAGHVTLARHYLPLIARNRAHRLGLWSWFGLYVFVSIKVGWILRPFVGDPALPTTFFREGSLDENPYVVLFWTVGGFFWSLAQRL